MRWIKWVIGILASVVIAFIVVLIVLPSEKIARIAVDQFRAQTGREVTLAGGVKISYYPVLGVSTGAVSIANADWSDLGPLLSAESLKIGVDFMALLSGDVKITGVEVIRPRILLERRADGSGNWELETGPATANGESSTTTDLSLDRALISSGSLRFIDHAAGTDKTVSDIDLVLHLPSFHGPADLDLTMSLAGSPIKVTARIAEFGKFFGGEMAPLSVQIAAAGSNASFDGQATMTPEAQGKLSADLTDTSAFLHAFGLGPADLPQGLGRSMKLDTTASLTPDMHISLRDTGLTLDQNALSGSVDVFLEEKPRITAELTAGALDFSALSRADGDGGGSGGNAWSTAAIDASGLDAVNAVVSLVAGSLDLGTLKFGKTSVLMTLDQSRAVVTLRELQGYSGSATGEFLINNRGGLSVGGKIQATGIELREFLDAVADVKRLTGKADARVNFLGGGKSVSAIMNSLKGDGVVTIGRGTIAGFDLDRLMRGGDAGGGTTIFDSMGATFTIVAGNLMNDDLLMRLPRLQATGKGRIGLGARDIDYLFTPGIRTSTGESVLAIPVRIRGPWSSPGIFPDLEAAIGANLGAETGAIKREVGTTVRNKIQQQLGATPGNGQSTGNTLKQRLEGGAAKGILKLLGGN